MGKSSPALSKLLSSGRFPKRKHDAEELGRLQLAMLRIQQGIWHRKGRAVVLFEGFDASGKGGAIRRLVEELDPRGFQVHAIGPPSTEELGQHYLARFWSKLPAPGMGAVFDRSWYGRVLVERVEKLTPKERWRAAYGEINEFEKMLITDGIEVVKIFLAIDADTQLDRFNERLRDPYKQWKLTEADVEARARWQKYVEAADEMFQRTHTRQAPWHLIPANDKIYARHAVLEAVTRALEHHGHWMESKAQSREVRSLKAALKDLGLKKNAL